MGALFDMGENNIKMFLRGIDGIQEILVVVVTQAEASRRQGHVTPQRYHCQADLGALSRRGALAQPAVLAEALVHNGLQTSSKHLEVGSARF